MIYLDTSAFCKLAFAEAESEPLREFLSARTGEVLVSSALIVVEARRAALRADPQMIPRTDLVLTSIGQLAIGRAVLESASRLPDGLLRSLDAVHLATALQVRNELQCFVTYDKRLAAAAGRVGLPVAAPAG